MAATLTAEMIADTWRPSAVRLSPDGRRVAWSAFSYGVSGEHDDSAIWVAGADGSDARRWTHGGRDTSPEWSPDGRHLAFLSDRAQRGTAGLYAMRTDGGEAVGLAVRSRAVAAFAWAPDGASLAFLATEEPGDEDERRERERDDADVFGERWTRQRAWVVDAGGGEPRRLDAGEGHVVELAFLPDSSAIVVIARPTPELDMLPETEVRVVPIDGGPGRRVCLAPLAHGLCIAAGGERIVYHAFHEPDPVSARTVRSVPVTAGGDPVVVGPGRDETVCALSAPAVACDARVVIAVAQGLDSRLEWCEPITGAREPLWATDAVIDAFDVVSDRFAAVMDDPRHGRAVWCGQLHSERVRAAPRRLSDHHPETVELGQVADLRFQSTDGWELDGVWIRPPGDDEGPWPTVVLPHGGPYSRSARAVYLNPLSWGQWLATAGYAVLLPNYRGSLGRGRAFAESVRGDVGNAEWRDVLAAVDAAVERGIADPARLGIGGWSQGGFLTAWGVTQTRRFRAGVVGAGVTDWTMLALTNDIPSFEVGFAGGPAWDAATRRHNDERSPVVHADSIETPLLLLHGQSDARVPLSQADALHRALRRREVPVEFVSYPREGHLIRERAHQLDILHRVRAWYDRWLTDPLSPPGPA